MKIGDLGSNVSALQKKLGVASDGRFGKETKAAVIAFQKANGLEADGIVGPATRAALGIPEAPYEAIERPKRSALARLYGAIDKATYSWPRRNEFMVKVAIPTELQERFAYDGNPTRSISCHKHMAGPLAIAMQNIISRHLQNEVREFNGCFNPRAARGSTRPSTHAYAMALDINASTNGLGKKPTMSRELVKCFTDAGFVWGGTWNRPDGMHFQFVTEA